MIKNRFHINPESGQVNICTASVGKCKYSVDGVPPEHYGTREEAEAIYEQQMFKNTFLSLSSNKKVVKKSLKKEAQLFSSFDEAQTNYFLYGPRSSKKIEPIHKAIATHFIEEGLKVSAKGVGDNKEIKVAGKLYNKDCDITIFNKNNEPSSVVEVKFITTNYKQNANNYFENFMGATSNLRRNDINVSQFIVLPAEIPYLDKAGNVKNIERITDKDIEKYRKLMLDTEDKSTPNNLFFSLINMWNGVEKGQPLSSFKPSSKIKKTIINPNDFNDQNIDFLQKHSDYNAFISDVVAQN